MSCLMIPDLLRCRFARGATNLHLRCLSGLRGAYGRACLRKPELPAEAPGAPLAAAALPLADEALPASSMVIKARGLPAVARDVWLFGGLLIFILNV